MTESLKRGVREAGSAARSTGDSGALAVLARVGLVSYGVVFVLLSWVAAKMAWGASAESGDKSGALGTLADDPLGRVLLWIIVVGLFALALWRLTDAIWGYQSESGTKRLRHRATAGVKAIVFAALGISAMGAATGNNSSDAAEQQQQTSGVLALPYGQILVIAAALIVIGVGVWHIIKGFRKKFMDYINKSTSSGMRSMVEKLGLFGYVSNGIALVLVGAILGYAAITFDPSKATGLDGALRLIITAPFGRILLTIIALGFLAYGLFQFARARYEDLST